MRLLQLPEDVLQSICEQLELKERVKLFSTCRQLRDFASSSAWWRRSLETVALQVDAPHVPSLQSWLHARRDIIKRLKLTTDAEGHSRAGTSMFLLGTLAGGGLVSLSLEAWGSSTVFDLDAWAMALPHLRHVQVLGWEIVAHRTLVRHPALATLLLVRPGVVAEEGERDGLTMGGGSLPPSLRNLGMNGFIHIPRAVALATQLRRLVVCTGLDGAEAKLHCRGLEQLTSLTSLTLRGLLPRPPHQLSALTNLVELDLSDNAFCQDGDASGVFGPLAPLTALQVLHMPMAFGLDEDGPEVAVRDFDLELPRLRVLGLAHNPRFASFPSGLQLSELEKLSIDADLAAASCAQLSEMGSLRTLHLGACGLEACRAAGDLQALKQQLPRLWDTLRGLEGLRTVRVPWELAETLEGPENWEAALKAWAQRLPSMRVVGKPYHAEGCDYSPRLPDIQSWDKVDIA